MRRIDLIYPSSICHQTLSQTGHRPRDDRLSFWKASVKGSLRARTDINKVYDGARKFNIRSIIIAMKILSFKKIVISL